MSKLTLPFKTGVTTEVEIKDENVLFYAEPVHGVKIPDQETVIDQGLEHPVGSPRLESLLDPKQKILLLVDDITRPTPSVKILSVLLKKIEKRGIPRSSIRIMMALGTHRPMFRKELVAKLGADVADVFPIINCDYRDPGRFVSLGKTQNGMPIEIAREVVDADFKIGIGNIVPHISAGWSGGGKIILPGASSKTTTDAMHLLACTKQPVLESIGNIENESRKEIEAVAQKVGLDFIVNTVLNRDHSISGLFAGHFQHAYRKGVAFAEKTMVVGIPRLADIMIVSSHPCHFDYWQGVKPYVYSQLGVREGGVIIFMLDGGEGLCGGAPSHEDTLRKYLLHSFDQLKEVAAKVETDDIVGLNVPMYHSQTRRRVTTFLVTNHLSKEDIDALGFIPAGSVQTALENAFELLGKDATVGIIPFGGETIVRVTDKEKRP